MSKPEFVYTTYIETSAEKLWHALTDGDFTERYWFGHRIISDWEIGSAFSLANQDGPKVTRQGTGVRSAAAARLQLGSPKGRLQARSYVTGDFRSRTPRQRRQADGHA